jgi:hypothetical protein
MQDCERCALSHDVTDGGLWSSARSTLGQSLVLPMRAACVSRRGFHGKWCVHGHTTRLWCRPHSASASSQAHISRRRKMIALHALLPASPRHCQVARKECKANQSDRRIATACWTRIRQRHSHSLAAERDSGRCCMCGVPCRRISDAFVRLLLKHCGTGRGLSHGGARHLRRQKTASAKRPS